MGNPINYDFENYEHLLGDNHRRSVLNWGTAWEIRRYALLSQVLQAFGQRNEHDAEFALSFNSIDEDDRIDLCVLAFLEADKKNQADDANDFFIIDADQMSESSMILWRGEASQWLRNYGLGFMAYTARSPFEMLQRGPLENLFRADYKFEVSFSGDHSSGRFSANDETILGENLSLDFDRMNESNIHEFRTNFISDGQWHTPEYALDLEFGEEHPTVYFHSTSARESADSVMEILKYWALKSNESFAPFHVYIEGESISKFDYDFIIRRNHVIQETLLPGFRVSGDSAQVTFLWKRF